MAERPKNSDLKQLLRFGMVLSSICLAATFVLALTYKVTRPKIEEQQKMAEQAALKLIMPDADGFKTGKTGDIEYYEAYKSGKLIGYCVKAVGTGYSGFIRMLVGITPDGTITGLEVLEQSETPGLGAKVKEIKPGAHEPWFTAQFAGKKASDLELRKNIDSIT
ncbi:MAG: FMN-binding protein, partial [Candidatus Omnitrophica bacterium]|nr:FMN-binding protein [Candidatus Omnitrophota bacterium]